MNDTEITRRRLLVTLGAGGLAAAAFAAAAPGRAGAESGRARQSEGRPSRAPELIGRADDWLNTNGAALKLYGANGLLKKGPVLLDFWEYTCVNCIRTLPYLKEWHSRYADKGLTIIGIHSPEFAFAKSRENVAAAIAKFGLRYPTINDADMANWEAWSNAYWPRKYLVDTKGRVVYDHAGEGGYGETERQIQKALKAVNPRITLPPLMEPVRGSDKPGAVCYPQTREIYAGFGRGPEYFGSKEGVRRNLTTDYTDITGKRENGVFYAQGRWKMTDESIRHARVTTDPLMDYIALLYTALETNAVIRPEAGKPFDLFLIQDNKPLDRRDKGDDVVYDDTGRSFVRVTEPRMYHLVKNARWGRHELRLGTTSPDFGLYSFTFSSCEVGGAS